MSTNAIQDFKWTPTGHGAMGGATFRLFKKLDAWFVRLAQRVTAEEHHFSVFISAAELKKLEYFKSFPHLIHFPVSLKMSDENLRAFADGSHIDAKGEMTLTETAPICDCLTPAACYHFYIYYQGQNLQEPKYLTTRAHCFRQENFYEALRRQRNFNMREIVCIGNADEVKSFLQKYQAIMTENFEKLRLPVSWEIATDPFFDPTRNPKFLMQTLDPVKQEMIFHKGTPKELSIGSVNFHKNYFGEAFEISSRGEEAFSGCVAFGLERWIHAITDTYGPEEKNWPNFDEMK